MSITACTEAEKNGLTGISKLPFSMKVILENLLRNEDGRASRRTTSRPSPPG
jgi:aconitate hydratase